MTKKIVEHIPVLTALIVVIGVIKLTLYYQNFGVPIKYFIGLSEIATTVADDLLLFILMYAVLKGVEIVVKDINPKVGVFTSNTRLNLLYSLFVLIINIGILIWFFLEKKNYNQIAISALQYFFFFLTLMQTKWGKEFAEKNREVSFLLYFFVLTTLNVLFMTSREIKSVMSGKYKDTKIVTDDKVYVASDTSYFIGQTDKFVFIYYTSKHCTVLPISSVREFDIHSK